MRIQHNRPNNRHAHVHVHLAKVSLHYCILSISKYIDSSIRPVVNNGNVQTQAKCMLGSCYWNPIKIMRIVSLIRSVLHIFMLVYETSLPHKMEAPKQVTGEGIKRHIGQVPFTGLQHDGE